MCKAGADPFEMRREALSLSAKAGALSAESERMRLLSLLKTEHFGRKVLLKTGCGLAIKTVLFAKRVGLSKKLIKWKKLKKKIL